MSINNADLKLVRADIVILASAHNPSILSPDWIKAKELITEEVKNYVNTPDFSLCELDNFSIIVDRERLQLTAGSQEVSILEKLSRFVGGYVKLLPHIPYRSLGLNFIWQIVESNESRNFPQIDLKVGMNNNLFSILPNHEIKYGGIVYAKKNPYQLKLVIEPYGKSGLNCNFNYHHAIEKVKENEIIKYLDNFIPFHEQSRKIVEQIGK